MSDKQYEYLEGRRRYWHKQSNLEHDEVLRLRKVLEAIGALSWERETKDAVRTALDRKVKQDD